MYKDRGTYQSDDWYSLALGNVAETPVIKAVVRMEMKKRILVFEEFTGYEDGRTLGSWIL